MKSILFSFGPFHLYSYGLLIAFGVFLSLKLMERELQRDPIGSKTLVQDLVLVTVVAGFLGARLYYVFENFSWYLENPIKIFAVWEGGLIFYGGVAGSLLGVFLFSKWKKNSLLHSLDFLIPYVALTQAFGRIGCFMNGCCLGGYCPYPWAVTFPDGPEHVHPVQLYEAFYLLVIFFSLSWFRQKKTAHGQVFSVYLISYGIGRFFIEFFRIGNPSWLFLTHNQWISLTLMSLGTVSFFILQRKKSKH